MSLRAILTGRFGRAALTTVLTLACLLATGGSAAAASADDAVSPSADVTSTLVTVAAHASRWSHHPRWQELEAGNLGEAPYHEPGQGPPRSPAQRLISFAEAALRPAPETDADDRAWCRQPTRWQRLQTIAKADGVSLPEASSCTSLDRFADPAAIVGLEVLFVAPTSARSSARFGHLLLRLRKVVPSGPDADDSAAARSDGQPDGSDDLVYEISAITGFRSSDLSFLAGGLTGDYPLVFDPQSLHSVLTENLHAQQRNIQRFSLNLTASQRRAVLRLLWQVERELALPYRFTNRNCGTYLLWLLAAALDGAPAIDPRVALWAAPAEVVDTLRRVTMPHNRLPLLHHTPGSFQTSGEQRDQARRALYSATSLQERLQAAVLVARAELDLAKATADKIRMEQIQPIPGHPLPDVKQLLQWRRQLYQREDRAWRRAVQVERLLWIDRYVDQAPRREATASELTALATARAAEAAFVQATDAYMAFSDS